MPPHAHIIQLNSVSDTRVGGTVKGSINTKVAPVGAPVVTDIKPGDSGKGREWSCVNQRLWRVTTVYATARRHPEAGEDCLQWCLAIRHAILTGVLDARIGLQHIPSERRGLCAGEYPAVIDAAMMVVSFSAA